MSHRHVVREGECLASIAARYGWPDGTALYEHAENASLRERRPASQLLAPGDVVAIPDRAPYRADAATGRWHRFVLEQPRDEVCVRVQLDDHDAPYANVPYEISIDGGPWIEGVTDAEGVIEHVVDAGARLAEVLLYPADEAGVIPIELELGTSGPVDVDGYAWERLDALGYYDEDDEEDESIEAIERHLDAELRELEAEGDDDGPEDEALFDDLREALDDARAEELFDEAWDEDELEGLELWDEPTVPSGEPSPRPRDANALAILAFQEDHGLELTGELDAATRSKLEAEYDGVG